MRSIFFISLIFLFSSCINLDFRSEYVATSYYGLNDEIELNVLDNKVGSSILIRSISVASAFETQTLFEKNEENQIQRFNYHKWQTQPSELLSDFIFNKLVSSEVFETGIMMGQSLKIPDYVIEMNVIDFSTYKIEKGREARFSIYFNLFQRVSGKRELVLSKEIATKTTVNGNKVKDIAPAMSEAITKACSELIISLQNTID